MKPIKWLLVWDAHPDGSPAGEKEYIQRHVARGALMMCKAQGYVCYLKPIFKD